MTQSGKNTTSIDLNQFNQVFFEECAEHLNEMEQILLSLTDDGPDEEQLNAIFRAAHSIKGGAGIFGFQDMTVVTHVLESLLDRMRNHEIQFCKAMVDLFLEAGDVISMQLAGHRDGSTVNQESVDQIRARLQQVIDSGGRSSCADVVDTVSGADREPEGMGAEAVCYQYDLEFTPDPDIFKRGVRLESLFAELEELGELNVIAEFHVAPEFSTFDPEICTSCWHLTLVTAASEADIREIFEFVADVDQLAVRRVPIESGDVGEVTPPDVPAGSEIQALPGHDVPDAVIGRRAYD